METINDVHQQFAEYFKSDQLKPYAYWVSRSLHEGHTCFSLSDAEVSAPLLPVYYRQLLSNDHYKLAEHPLVSTGAAVQPFVLYNSKVYLQRYFVYETRILNRIQELIAAGKAAYPERAYQLKAQKALINSLFPVLFSKDREIATMPDWQLIAALNALLNNFTIITGGPGTGKTTTVAKILRILFSGNTSLKVALAAPTGKAAVRMAESLKSSAAGELDTLFDEVAPVTIHRLLKVIPDTPYFRHDRTHPLNYDVIIIDEASMIDAALFSKLLDAVSSNTRLIMLGDKDQLASVEAGSLLGDLCRTQPRMNVFSGLKADFINTFIEHPALYLQGEFLNETDGPLKEHIIELQHSFRFSVNEGIGKLSAAIISNEDSVIKDFMLDTANEQVLIDTGYDDEIFSAFISGYETYIKEPDISAAIQKLNMLRVLCAVREGEKGLLNSNRKIEAILRSRQLITTNADFYEHRPVIITRNYYHLGLYNGDTGICRADEKGVMKVWFENSRQEINYVLPGYISDAETVFAMTVHKSQGSEYDQVLVILPEQKDISLLTRELLYTAVTRAKKKVIIQAGEDVLLATAEKQVKRASGITERFFKEKDLTLNDL